MAPDNHDIRLSVLEQGHAALQETVREALTEWRDEIRGQRLDMRQLSETLIRSTDTCANCQATLLPHLRAVAENHGERLQALEDAMRESRTFRRQFGRALTWGLGLLAGAVGALWADFLRRR